MSESRDYGTEAMLFMAVECDSPEMVEMMLKKGANVNAREPDGTTPLMRAAYLGNPNAAKFLIEHGADTNAMKYVWLHATDDGSDEYELRHLGRRKTFGQTWRKHIR